MTGHVVACVLASPLLWFGYTSMDGSVLGGLMGFGAMFSSVYALMSLIDRGTHWMDG